MNYARIADGIVTTTQTAEADGFIQCPDEVQPGWTFDGANWVNPNAEKERITRIKSGCRNYILAALPEWKQANLTAAAVEALKDGQPVPQVCLDAWAFVKSARAHSDALEASGAQDWSNP